ncbi:putative amidohydrolase [Paraburkholderia sp. WSM4179]|nr:putative amidohydrolase [Paraburkholderia sp. WSM4179]
MKTRIALAQINVTVGDFAGNVAKIVAAARAAHSDGAKLLVAPELALSGYPPEDLLLRPAFYTASAAALADLAAQLKPFTRSACDRRPSAARRVGQPRAPPGERPW